MIHPRTLICRNFLLDRRMNESYLEETRYEHGDDPTGSVAEGEQRLKKEQW
jgi:hypothetical protein